MEHNEHLQSAQAQVTQELEEQSQELARERRQTDQLATKLRMQLGVDTQTHTASEIEFARQANIETRDSVLFTLDQLLREFPEMADRMQTLMDKAGLVVPARPPSRIASRGDNPAF